MKTGHYVLIGILVLALAAGTIYGFVNYGTVNYGTACPRKATAWFLDDYTSLVGQFSDTFNRAASTSRIALSPVIGELQSIKRDVNSLDDVCEEATQLKAATVYAMDASIDGFMLFMADAPDDDVAAKFGEATRWTETATRKIGVLAKAAGGGR